MDKAAKFYLANYPYYPYYPYSRNGNTEVREAEAFSVWWNLFFAKSAQPTDSNLKTAMDAWRHARSVSV